MTTSETRTTRSAPPIPRPREAEVDAVETDVVEPGPAPQPEHPAATYPWPEPWRSARGARPRSEYWDVATASWHSRGPKA
jgi:hypothetical protein